MSDDFSTRAARGQAYNLAVSTAIAEGRAHDNKFIMEQFLRHLDMAALLQRAKIDDLVTALDNPKFIELIRAIDKELK